MTTRCPFCQRPYAPPIVGVSRRMKLCAEVIRDFTAKNGYSPSYGDLADALGSSSRGGVHGLVKALKRRGWVPSSGHRDGARSLMLTESAEAFLREARP